MLERFNYVSSMRRMQCHGKKCELLNDVGEMIVEGRITCDLREPILDEDLVETEVWVSILSCPNDKSQILSIWKWLLL